MNVNALRKRTDKLIEQVDRSQQQPIRFITYWAGEEIPDDGQPHFTTEWCNALNEEGRENE